MRLSVVQSSQANKTSYLSFLAMLSSLAVIYLHYNGVFWQRPTGGIWVSANIIEAVFYFAVPIFFMISGCTLIDYKEKYDTKTFFIKRIKKTVFPFLVWSGMACLYEYFLHPIRFQGVGLGDIFQGILDATYMPVYWFFMPLFSIYLCMPILTDIKHKKETFTYVVLIGIFVISIAPFLNGFGIDLLPKGFSFPICGAYLIYPLLGYLLHHTSFSFKCRMLIYGLGLLSLLAHIGVTTWMTPM
ncbi:MAG: acyltransferase family protein, partial [bacterium]|nr:acyltransferase family protein [bacterium]